MINRVLITGATGLIGRGICSELGAEHDVLFTARNISNLSGWIQFGDFRSLEDRRGWVKLILVKTERETCVKICCNISIV